MACERILNWQPVTCCSGSQGTVEKWGRILKAKVENMKKNSLFLAIAILFLLENIAVLFLYNTNHLQINIGADISGVYKLANLQSQDSEEFKPMADVEILKIFADGLWISPAYDKNTKKVVSLSGGRYRFDPTENKVEEEVLFNMKDPSSIGLNTSYMLYLDDKGFYQSGIYKAGKQDAWKVEENWIKELNY